MEVQTKHSRNSGRGIPIDLLIDIFSRVPANTIAKCRCVSKLWGSIVNRPDFTELFLSMSSTRRGLFLFTIEDKNNLYFYSSPQPQISDESMCLVVPTTRYHVQHKQSLARDRINAVGSPLPGFVYLQRRNTLVIWNPVTGDSISLPKVPQKGKAELKFPRCFVFKYYIGYNPIDKQIKVILCTHQESQDEHHILTLDNQNNLWRKPQCKTHYPLSNGICIDGVVYYAAGCDNTDGFDSEIMVSMIVCFHVRSEEFSFINISEEIVRSTLINYKGKLALLQFVFPHERLPSPIIFLQFCLLQDAEKHIWSHRIYTLPPLLLNNILESTRVHIHGMIGTGDELVLSLYPKRGPVTIYYFNLENNRITRVQCQGLEMFNDYKIHISLDYIENLKLCSTLMLDR